MTDAPDLSDPSLYINRELSWLAFNQRVLAQAKSDAHPAARASEVSRDCRQQSRRVFHGARGDARATAPRRPRNRRARRPQRRPVPDDGTGESRGDAPRDRRLLGQHARADSASRRDRHRSSRPITRPRCGSSSKTISARVCALSSLPLRSTQGTPSRTSRIAAKTSQWSSRVTVARDLPGQSARRAAAFRAGATAADR